MFRLRARFGFFLLGGLLLLVCSRSPAPGFAGPHQYDLLIRNARILDGTGSDWWRADIAIRDGRIVRIGRLLPGTAAQTLDASDRVAVPGFVDVHVHVEDNLPENPDAENLVADGVTSVVTGNCGASAEDIGAFLGRLERSGTAINVGTLVGHNTVRSRVMGFADRSPTPFEQIQLEEGVRRALRDGALGFSTGLIYAPGTFSRAPEIARLASIAGERGGIYATHMRSENDRVFESVEESLTAARAARITLQISHLKVTSRALWGRSERLLARIADARESGLDVAFDEYPYTASSSGLDVLLPEWALEAGRGGARRTLLHRLTRAKLRRRIAAEVLRRLSDELGHEDLSYAVVASAPWSLSIEGKSLAAIDAERRGRPAGSKDLARQIETALWICEQGARSGQGGGACGTQMIYHTMSDEDVERIFASPLAMVARDGGVVRSGIGRPHPRSYGTAARVLARFVRERQLVSLPDAIRKMTSFPAQRFGLRQRGLLREGFWADLVLFDPACVEDLSTFDAPHQFSRGFDYVLVNGTIVRDAGKPTGARPGKILRGLGYENRAALPRTLRSFPSPLSRSES